MASLFRKSRVATAVAGAPGRQALLSGLNEDLEREFQAIVRYTQFAASVRGRSRPELAALFRSEIPEELAHAHFLADKIAALGGQPTTTIPPIETVQGAENMVAAVVEAERQDVERYTRRAREAEAAGELGLQVQLENIVVDETRHMEEMQKILSD